MKCPSNIRIKELEFLRDSNVISEEFYKQIVDALPDRYQSDSKPIQAIGAGSNASSSTNAGSNTVAPPPGPPPAPSPALEYAEALYPYKPQQPEDLELRAGDKIQVLEHTSKDWWKGSIGSRSGMFPSNYVKVLDSAQAPPPIYQQRSESQVSVQQPVQQMPMQQPMPQQVLPQPMQQYYSPPPQQQPMMQMQQVQQVENQVQQQVQQAQQMQQQVQQVQQQHQQHSQTGEAFKKFGSKLGNAAIFGAGATLGSDLVNSIF